jgi:hypothetical protein
MNMRNFMDAITGQSETKTEEPKQILAKEGLFKAFLAKDKKPPQSRMNQVSTPRDQKKDVEDWAGPGHFDYRKAPKKSVTKETK